MRFKEIETCLLFFMHPINSLAASLSFTVNYDLADVFARPVDLVIWPYHLILRCLSVDRISSCCPMFSLIIYIYIAEFLVGDLVRVGCARCCSSISTPSLVFFFKSDVSVHVSQAFCCLCTIRLFTVICASP